MKMHIYFLKRWKPFASCPEFLLGKRHFVRLREVVHCRCSRPGQGSVTPQPSPFQKGLCPAKAGTGRRRPLRTDTGSGLRCGFHAGHMRRSMSLASEIRKKRLSELGRAGPGPAAGAESDRLQNHDFVFHYKNKTLKIEKMWRLEKGALSLCFGHFSPSDGALTRL